MLDVELGEMSVWIPLLAVDDLEEGQAKRIQMDGYSVPLDFSEAKFFAISDACPHMLASLSRGVVQGTSVFCPWHQACFSLTSGASLSTPNYGSVQTYNLRTRGENVEIEWPPKKNRLSAR